MARRDWSEAEFKRGPCRVCGKSQGVELAHVTRRVFDEPRDNPNVLVVKADSVVPLCGPSTDPTSCHGKFDGGRLDLLPFLTRSEQVQAVADVGLEIARIRTAPSDYRQVIEDARQLAAIDEASAASPAYGRAA